ncbi:cell division protein FtsQ/DivIB [Croceimicrobium hydrocarbonivorans]|uniref:Cell division protein FtsQ n=1 Tax=Croceimicrobium hydrocarbonivorans TaxID=2761580 RepID=A0A7H0VI27_9FLAO|nr:cell division protein FtsQ/DivIB [Croceimicrobium hydrocarbonivorans]QNR25375.1 hypothetical protein H4K34_05910 [Croceimicrobium hydrocarbonivorans]
MKLWHQIAIWTGGLSTWILLVSSASNAYDRQELKDFKLQFENRQDRSFLSLLEMEKQVQKELGDSSLQLAEINKALLEESIDNHPAIRKAEVYSKIDGSLRIMLWQHDPLARVIDRRGSFYLLDAGEKMPLSPYFSEEVPLVSGDLNDEDLVLIASFWQSLKQDEFYQQFFTGLHCNEQKEWTLFPAKGNFKIRVGKPEELEEKLTKLKVFYTQAPAPKYLNKLKEIDLRFEGQLICRKN